MATTIPVFEKAHAGPFVDALAERLDRIEATQQRILQLLEQQQHGFPRGKPSAPLTRADVALLLVVAEAVGESAFSASEILRHTAVHPALREALDASGIVNPR